MAYDRFLNREAQPEMVQIRKRVGREVLPVWDDVLALLETAYAQYEPELIFYNAQQGWGFRYRQGSQQLCVLFPERGAFTALLVLNAEMEARAQAQINYFNARLRGLLNRPSNLPQGRWLWLRLEDHTDYVGFKWLLAMKDSI